MPNKEYCQNNRGKSVETINLEHGYASNLCRRPLPEAKECAWDQGQAKQGLRGEPIVDVYSSPEARHANSYLSDRGQGLFVHGGNPIYFTSKASPVIIIILPSNDS